MYVSTLANIFVASLSNAYRHTYCARISDLTVTVLRKSEIPQTSLFHHKVEEKYFSLRHSQQVPS